MGRSGSTKKRPREVALAKVKDDLSKYLRLAAGEEIIITRHGRPAGVLIGFESEDDWFDYRIENHPEFLRQIAASRLALQKGLGIRLEDLDPGRPNTYEDSPSQETKISTTLKKQTHSKSAAKKHGRRSCFPS